MSAASDYLELEILDHVLGKGTRDFTSPANLYIGLHTADPTDAGTGTEVSGNAYARTAVTFNAANQPSTGQTFADNSATVTFPTANGGNWGTITHIAVWDASTSGNMLFHGALTASKTVNDGDTFQIQGGNLVISLA